MGDDAVDLRKRLNSHLAEIENLENGQFREFNVRRKLEEQLQGDLGAIASYISEAVSNDWAHPSKERQTRIKEIGAMIAPHNESLASLMYAKEPELKAMATKAGIMLKYTEVDQRLEQRLRRQLNISYDDAARTIELLSEHRLVTQQDIKKGLDYLYSETDLARKLELTRILAILKVPDTVPVVKELLSIPYRKEDSFDVNGLPQESYAEGMYRVAQEAIAYLGPHALTLRPVLEERIREIQAAEKGVPIGAHPFVRRWISIFSDEIERIEGRRAVETHMAVNGSGILSMEVKASTHEGANEQSHKNVLAQGPQTSENHSIVGSKSIQKSPNSLAKHGLKQLIVFIAAICAVLIGVTRYYMRKRRLR